MKPEILPIPALVLVTPKMKVTNGNLQSTCAGVTQNNNQTVIVPEQYETCTWTRGPDVFTSGGVSPCVVVAYDLAQ